MWRNEFRISSLINVFTAGVALIGGAAMAGNQQNAPSPPPLDNLPPTWSQKLPAAKRFVLVLDGQAVLDKETGLVWERSPSTIQSEWFSAQDQCKRQKWGNRLGWRLPTVEELATLVDPTVPAPGPTLASGHPFIGVQQWKYWSATTPAGATDGAYGVDFDWGGVDTAGKINGNVYHWCVRGGQGVESQW